MSNNQSLNSLTPDAAMGQIITAEKNAGALLVSIGLSPDKHKSETLQVYQDARNK